jgi:hypothetical protein
MKEWRLRNPDKRKAQQHRNVINRILKTYALDRDEYFKSLEKGCMICGSFSRLCVDHDHDTNEYRGILCHKCNTGIGMLGDTIEGIEKAYEYLNRKTIKLPEDR